MTKFAAYVARILLCESCKFREKNFYSNWDNEFFLRYCFLLAHHVLIEFLKITLTSGLTLELALTLRIKTMQTKKLLIYLARSYSGNVFLFVFNSLLSSPRCSERNGHIFTKISGLLVRCKGLFNTL